MRSQNTGGPNAPGFGHILLDTRENKMFVVELCVFCKDHWPEKKKCGTECKTHPWKQFPDSHSPRFLCSLNGLFLAPGPGFLLCTHSPMTFRRTKYHDSRLTPTYSTPFRHLAERTRSEDIFVHLHAKRAGNAAKTAENPAPALNLLCPNYTNCN